MDDRRRRFLKLTGLATVAAASAAYAESELKDPPAIGVKFDRDGSVLPLVGNTVICHFDQQGANAALFNAMLDIYRDGPRHDFMKKVALLPPSSYHMTIFSGADELNRKVPLWPASVPVSADMSACHAAVGAQLRKFKLDCALPLRMKVDVSEPGVNERPLRLRLSPVDAAEEAKLRGLRDRLSTHLGIRGDDHVTYQFHTTIGYLIRWLTPVETLEFRDTLLKWTENVAARAPVIELGAPEYCVFPDMYAFHREFFLA
jgi:hypothetical protein